jgi:hypothetical protein
MLESDGRAAERPSRYLLMRGGPSRGGRSIEACVAVRAGRVAQGNSASGVVAEASRGPIGPPSRARSETDGASSRTAE